MAARATRTALIVASVPELVKRTISIDGTSDRTFSAIRTSSSRRRAVARAVPRDLGQRAISAGGAWPWISGPHDIT